MKSSCHSERVSIITNGERIYKSNEWKIKYFQSGRWIYFSYGISGNVKKKRELGIGDTHISKLNILFNQEGWIFLIATSQYFSDDYKIT